MYRQMPDQFQASAGLPSLKQEACESAHYERSVFAGHTARTTAQPGEQAAYGEQVACGDQAHIRQASAPSIRAVSKRPFEGEDRDSGKRAKSFATVHFSSTERMQDGPDLITQINSDLIDGTIKQQIFNCETLLHSVRTSIKTSGFIDPKLQESLKTSSGQKLVECATLLVVHKRLQLLANRIQERFSHDGSLCFVLPSHACIGPAFIPVIARLQATILSIIEPCEHKTHAPQSPGTPQGINGQPLDVIVLSKIFD